MKLDQLLNLKENLKITEELDHSPLIDAKWNDDYVPFYDLFENWLYAIIEDNKDNTMFSEKEADKILNTVKGKYKDLKDYRILREEYANLERLIENIENSDSDRYKFIKKLNELDEFINNAIKMDHIVTKADMELSDDEIDDFFTSDEYKYGM